MGFLPASRCGGDLFFLGSFSALADSQAASPRTSRPIVDVRLGAPIRGRLAAEVLYVGDALRGYDAPVPAARFSPIMKSGRQKLRRGARHETISRWAGNARVDLRCCTSGPRATRKRV